MRLPLAQATSPAPPPSGGIHPAQRAVESLQDLAAGFFAGAPRVGIAALVFVMFLGIGKLVQRGLEPRLTHVRTPSFGRVFAALAYAGVAILGLVVTLPIAFPSVSVATVVGGLGVVGLAAGFALQDILSNLVAGILLIFRQPFTSGDQVEVADHKGSVEGITVRETRLRNYDGRLVIIPNKDVYSSTIKVQTAYEAVRTSLSVGVGYDTDLSRARRIALGALAELDAVLDEPPPQAYYSEFGDSSLSLELRYWTGPQQAEVRRVQDGVVEAIHDAFTAAGVDMPFTTITLDAAPSFRQALGRAPSSPRQRSQTTPATPEIVQRVYQRLIDQTPPGDETRH